MAPVDEIIESLDLKSHPEGGYYKETYRSQDTFKLGTPYNGNRNHSTAIYYLLTAGIFSAFHRIHQDEIWHFYQGDSIDLHVILPSGKYQLINIGHQWSQNQIPQYVVPGGSWFAAEVGIGGSYSLVGCTVSPGFDFEDFELANRSDLQTLCPEQALLIEKLTR